MLFGKKNVKSRFLTYLVTITIDTLMYMPAGYHFLIVTGRIDYGLRCSGEKNVIPISIEECYFLQTSKKIQSIYFLLIFKLYTVNLHIFASQHPFRICNDSHKLLFWIALDLHDLYKYNEQSLVDVIYNPVSIHLGFFLYIKHWKIFCSFSELNLWTFFIQTSRRWFVPMVCHLSSFTVMTTQRTWIVVNNFNYNSIIVLNFFCAYRTSGDNSEVMPKKKGWNT